MSTHSSENSGGIDKTQEVVKLESVSSDEILAANAGKPYTYDAEERSKRLQGGATMRDVLVVLCAGFALISDGYQNNVMTMTNSVFTLQYPSNYDSKMKTQVSNASTVGTIFGQLVIGFTADLIGRKWSIVVATCVLIFGTVMCAASHGRSVEGMLWMLTIFRGVTGFGIGAEYPSSSVAASEAANESMKKRGGAFILCTNLPLTLGGPFAIIIFLILQKIVSAEHEGLWRAMFAIGAFWPLSVFYFRLKMVTSELYKQSAIRKQTPPYWLTLKFYWRRLFGTCACWFLYDFVTFPNGVFSAGIISTIIDDSSDLEKVGEWTLLLSVLSLPGLFIGAWLMDRIGRKYTLMIGFTGYIVFGLIVGCSYYKLRKITALFVVFYGLMQSSGNLGPGNAMGLVSSESFSSPVRGTCYGISAAIGKVGAVVGTEAFTPIQNSSALGPEWTFIIAAICGVLGVIIAFICIPHLKEDDLMREDIKFKNYLVANGWKGHFGLQESDEESHDEK